MQEAGMPTRVKVKVGADTFKDFKLPSLIVADPRLGRWRLFKAKLTLWLIRTAAKVDVVATVLAAEAISITVEYMMSEDKERAQEKGWRKDLN